MKMKEIYSNGLKWYHKKEQGGVYLLVGKALGDGVVGVELLALVDEGHPFIERRIIVEATEVELLALAASYGEV